MPRLAICSLLLALGIATARLAAQDPAPAELPAEPAATAEPAEPAATAEPSEPAATAGPAEAAPAVTATELARWVEELDADQFVVRETAMQNLIAAGDAAIDPLLAAVATERWELNSRCVHILQQIALSGEPDAEEAARLALETIATRPVRSASLRARETLAGIDSIRQQRALHELIRLGAKTLPDDRPQLIAYITGLEIDENWRGTERDLRQLRWLKDIDYLSFTGGRVTDEWLTHILELPNLFQLTLKRTATTDASLAELHQLKQLRRLELKYVPITDGAVPHLARLTDATELRLFGTDMTPEGAQRLQAELLKTAPQVKVDYRRGAFLGIGGDFHTLGCSVLEVRDNTAAARAGILEGDVVVAYAGQRVENFESLTQLIAQNRPGDMVPIDFVRQAEIRSAARLKKDDTTLGVQGKAHVLGCEITEVAPKSLAEQMAFSKGDVIYRLNGQAVTNPETLVAAFEEMKAGELATFEYVRHVEVRHAQVKLGEWE